MKVFILGVGDAFTSKKYNTCFIVQAQNGFNLAVECPHPYLKILEDARNVNREVPQIKDVNNFIVTHLHSDHCGGLETLGFYKKFVEGRKLDVHMHWNDSTSHREMVDPAMGTTMTDKEIKKTWAFDYFNYEALTAKIGPFEVRQKTTEHYIPANALLISEGDKTLGFSSDTKFDRDLIEWLDNADFILHETGPAPGHAPLSDLAALPKEIKRKIRIIHYNDALVTDQFRLAAQGDLIYLG
jgi:ribonuclease BN (tRNA processing enzyme)